MLVAWTGVRLLEHDEQRDGDERCEHQQLVVVDIGDDLRLAGDDGVKRRSAGGYGSGGGYGGAGGSGSGGYGAGRGRTPGSYGGGEGWGTSRRRRSEDDDWSGAVIGGGGRSRHREDVIDAALAPKGPVSSGAEALGLKVGDDVRHGKFGDGVITAIEGSGDKAEAVVHFAGMGEKRLLLAWAPLQKI